MSHLMELTARCHQDQAHDQQLEPSLKRPDVSSAANCSSGSQPDARDKRRVATLHQRLAKT